MARQEARLILKVAFGFAILTLLVALFGRWALNTEPKPEAVTCQGEVTRPGDTCAIYREPGHVLQQTKSYEEIRQGIRGSNIVIGWIAVVVAVVLALLTLLLFVVGVSEALDLVRHVPQHS